MWLLFQCVFYTGSWVKESEYAGLASRLAGHPGVESVRFHGFIEPVRGNGTVLVGHSLGGYYALRDAVRFPEKVAGVVLLNSHFNSRWVMPYPGVATDAVRVPVLTVLGGRDERLPVRKALDDAWECTQEHEWDKFFVVNRDHGHFTGVTTEEGREDVVRPINAFLDALATRNFTAMRRLDAQRRRFRTDLYYLSEHAVVASQPVNIIDAILRVVAVRWWWRTAHFMWFLSTKPDRALGYTFVGDDHIFLKGRPQDAGGYGRVLDEWLRGNDYLVRDTDLPAVHPAILAWLLCPVRPTLGADGSTILAPRAVLRVDNETTYYKIPNPRRFFPLLPDERFFDF